MTKTTRSDDCKSGNAANDFQAGSLCKMFSRKQSLSKNVMLKAHFVFGSVLTGQRQRDGILTEEKKRNAINEELHWNQIGNDGDIHCVFPTFPPGPERYIFNGIQL